MEAENFTGDKTVVTVAYCAFLIFPFFVLFRF